MSIRKQLIYIGLLTLCLVENYSVCGQQTAKVGKRTGTDTLSREDKATDYFYRGVLAQRVNRMDEALDLLQQAYQLSPKDPMIAFALGGTYMDAERQSEALPLLEQAYRSDSTDIAFASALSSAYIATERMEDALRVNKQLLSLDPDDVDVKYRLVQLYARTGYIPQAIQMCTELQTRFRPHPEPYNRLTQIKIQLHQLAGNKKAIEQEYETQASLFSGNRKYYYDLILFLIQDGRYQEVNKRLAADVKKQTIRPGDARALRVHLHIAKKEYEQAEQELVQLSEDSEISAGEKFVLWSLLSNEIAGEEKLLDERYMPRIKRLLTVHPEDLSILRSYVQLLRYRDHHQEAIDVLRPQTKLHPSTAWLWDELFQNAVGLSQDSLIVQVAREAVQYVPEDWRYHIALATGDFAEDRFSDAIKTLERGASAINPKKGDGAARLYGLLADLYAERGSAAQRVLADSLYRLAIEANPNDPDVLNNYAYRLAKAGKELELAEQYAGQAVKLNPDVAHILDTYAYILHLRGNDSLARLYQRKAIDKAGDKSSGDMYDHMGDILLALGDQDEALLYFISARKVYEEQGDLEEKQQVDAKIARLQNPKVKETKVTKKKKR